MADKVLREKRKLFIHSVGTGTINGLLDELLEKRVLNQEEMEKVRAENATVMDKARALIDSVIRKGPQACQICISHICEDDCHLAGVLGLSSGPQSGNFPKTQDAQAVVPAFPAPQAVQDNPARPRGSLKLCSPEIVQKIWNEKSAEIYPIIRRSLTRTRLALIICNTEFDNLSRRDGAEADIINMTVLLEGLGYNVAVKENLTALGMTTELKAFAARPEHQTSDSTFLVFMSHGIRDGICGKKFSKNVPDILEVNTIFQIFNTWNCPSLRDKPKVIIIQACRGENEGVVWLKDSVEASGNSFSLAPEDFEDDAIRKAHIEKDFIAFCSSTPDNVSWRHPRWGSLFILNLIENLQEYAWSCDLEEIFRKVRLSFEPPDGRVQMPTTERVTLTRCFYLFPGYMAEDKRERNILKALESVGKELITGISVGLVEKDVLKLKEDEKKKFYEANPRDKPWVLVDSVRDRRHEAGQMLLQTFLNTEKNSTRREASAEIMPGPVEPTESTDTLKLCPHETYLQLCKERAEEIYPIKEKKDRTRLALIICNTEFDHLPVRTGADLDITGMKGLLEELGYSVEVKEKLTARDMQSVLQEFAARQDHRSSDSTFLVFMSHGILDGICGTTHSDENPDVLPYDTIFRIFNNQNCPSLKDKPKVIIVQACRGANRGELWVRDCLAAWADSPSVSPENLEEDAVHKTHVEKDFIAFCSSTPHNVSWRDITKGSLFITQLITCFQKYSWRCHLEEVFRKVQQSFEKPSVKTQMPTIERQSMSRYFYLFPGN
ncbi:PREDICTED: caspase-1-like [Ceratotherium simum simum]|uniref:Caspase-1-like n=1 Tax=Ceratotherium simum simum TaxID=73337 RepID=A0ABM1CLS6_CERSS|nr:PREDICTED: caspase-1-like [Ceratotherium simum simum]